MRLSGRQVDSKWAVTDREGRERKGEREGERGIEETGSEGIHSAAKGLFKDVCQRILRKSSRSTINYKCT